MSHCPPPKYLSISEVAKACDRWATSSIFGMTTDLIDLMSKGLKARALSLLHDIQADQNGPVRENLFWFMA